MGANKVYTVGHYSAMGPTVSEFVKWKIEKEMVEYMVRYIKHLNEHHFDHSKIPKLYEMLISEDPEVREMGKEIINSFINE